ncbi:MAG: DEAD/DEAH box helicase [Treponema sp.]|nr:DEAD/DEAH box helicase [Treponema sp.]
MIEDILNNSVDNATDQTFTDEKIENETPDTVTFEDLGLDEYTLKAVAKKGFVTPSPIQVLAIPRLLTGDTNLIARARTGTGKTAAFGLPIIQNVRGKSDHVEALVLEPTRELAMQTCTEMQSFATDAYPRTAVLYGGASYSAQIKELKRGCEVVVGTPGRIKDHIARKTLDISKIKYFILDEGDEMLDMGFIDDIEEIFRHANPDCRILLFSATMPAPILKIAGDFMGEYDIIEEENVIDEALLIDQKYWVVKESEKIEALVRLIDISPDFYGLVFTMTKSDADRVTRELDLRGYEAAALHGDIMQNQREKVLERFRMKKTRILVATDVAARGIDIKGVSHVVNYSLPFDTATYVHRIGRTGRAGTEGFAFTFVKPEERRKLGFLSKNIKKATKSDFTEGKIPSVNEVLNVKNERVIKELKEKLFIETEKKAEGVSVIESAAGEGENAADATPLTAVETFSTLREELLTPLFKDLASALCENQEPQQVLAGVLSIMYGDKLSPKHYGKVNTNSGAPRGDQLRIFISLGKKDGYRAKEIADYFSELLHIPGRLVDDIDVAQQFSLVSLPIASARKAIEMSKSNKKLPHMHIDEKEGGRGPRRPRDRGSDFDSPRSDDRSRGKRSSDRREKSRDHFGSESGASPRGRAKGNRPNVHAQSERSSSRKSGGASLYKKSSSSNSKGGKKVERF